MNENKHIYSSQTHLLKTKFRILSCQVEVNGLREINCQSPCPLKTELES